MKRVRAGTRTAPGDRHPIAVAAERTGLTQDVLRVWERRYQAVQPIREKGGRRLYTNADIDRLILLNAAAEAGRSIGQIAGLSDKALARMVEEDTDSRISRAAVAEMPAVDTEDLVTTALALTRSLASAPLDAHLRRAVARLGIAAFVERVAAPLLRLVGDEWHAKRLTPSQEHLASSIVHDILIAAMRGFTHGPDSPRVLVATPAGERHAIGAALAGAFAAVEGWNVIYLGTDLPASEIAAAAVTADVSLVALSIVHVDDRERVLGEMRSLRGRLPDAIGMTAGGTGATLLKRELTASGVRVAEKIEDLFASVGSDVR
ncbi:MAG: MerR family transcriptional regulator [Gemmatimonadaceae bacterium]